MWAEPPVAPHDNCSNRTLANHAHLLYDIQALPPDPDNQRARREAVEASPGQKRLFENF
jgi:hypothetical protein